MADHYPTELRSIGVAGRVGRVGRLLGAAALAVFAVVKLLFALGRTKVRYATPSSRHSSSKQHALVWAPGVVATVVAALAAVVTVGWLVRNWTTRPTRRSWWLIFSVVVFAGAWTAVTTTLNTPNYWMGGTIR